ncbi:hypothetical protein FIE12Z_3523 [Fusarium flagelliforme]|uniref:peptidylprolyl isomerase n=1 Tax=Fusarium flagelliforme TaxID=2675880 RepID=A0A395MWM9_9HYPO|nr:hypothetical protein FIE12Z_3523 [Fusarium flagelliforme]
MDARPPKTPVTNRKSYSQKSLQAPLSARLDPERRRWSSINDQADYMSSSKGKGKAPATNPEQDSQPQSLSQLQPGPITYRKGRKSFAPRIGYDADWLREMCDSIRSNLHDGRPEPRWEELMGFLKAVLRDENDGSRAIEFETIRNTHLDKLISEIINPRYRHPRVPTRFTTDIQLAERLERKWIERFRGPYFHIEQHRYRELSRHGRLRDVTLNLDAENPEDRWQANDGETLSEMEGNLEIEPGHWWLNLACAHRDGIVGSNREKPTKGKYGVAALPLLTGQENIDYDDGAIRYVRQEKMGKNDKKGADKGGKAKGGDKGKDAKDSGSGGKAKGAQSINVRHILCEKHAKKEEALAKLNDGVKFDEVAREFSEDKARQGGSLGWKTKGSLDPKFEEVAFALEPSTTTSPKFVEVKTGFGYHIIMMPVEVARVQYFCVKRSRNQARISNLRHTSNAD